MPQRIAINGLKLGFVLAILYYLLTSISGYELTPQSIKELQQQSVSPQVLNILQEEGGTIYDSVEAFQAHLQATLSEYDWSLYGPLIIKAAAQPRLNLKRLALLTEHPGLLATLVGSLLLIVIPLAAFRWWLLLRALGLEVSKLQAFWLTWIGNFFNTTLPGAVSGDLVKGYYIIKAQEAEGKTKAFTTLLIDRFVGLFGLIVMASLTLMLNPSLALEQKALQPMVFMIAGLFIGTLVFYGIVLFPFKEGQDPFLKLFAKLPASKLLIKVYSAFKAFEHQRPTLIYTLIIAIMIHSVIAFLFFQIASLLHMDQISLASQLFIMPIGLIVLSIPVAPGGIGVGHVAFESLYSLLGVHGGADIFNLYVIVQLAVFLLGGIPYFFYKSQSPIPDDLETLDEENPT